MKQQALLIGINEYDLLGSLDYALQDAEAIGRVLRESYGFASSDISIMSCSVSGASRGLSSYIERALDRMKDHRSLDLLVFGFWGHGFAPKPGKRYLCGLDACEDDLERTAVSLDVVKAKLSQVQSENTLIILDCCQNKPAGRNISTEAMTRGEQEAIDTFARDIQLQHKKSSGYAVPTVAILNACSEGEKAYEWREKEHGIFTAHLLENLTKGFGGIAQVAANTTDSVIKTASNIYGTRQTPFVKIEGKGDIFLSNRQETGKQPEFVPRPVPKAANPVSGKKARYRKALIEAGADETITSKEWEMLVLLRGELGFDISVYNEIEKSIWSGATLDEICRGYEEASRPEGDLAKAIQYTLDDFKEVNRSVMAGKGSLPYLKQAYKKHFDYWKKAAESGNPEGQYLHGECLEEGLDIEKSAVEAVRWYRKAAEQGLASAQHNLGFCYERGKGVSKDEAEAVRWFRKAAEQGDASAQFDLGFCYQNGKGVSKDKAEAVKWYSKAAEQGDASAQHNLGFCYERGKGVSKDEAEAVRWFRKAAEQGDASAQFDLGFCYQNGKGVSKDKAEAVRWFRKAAEQGDAWAQDWLGFCYQKGLGVSKDEAEAVRWYRKAAEQGHAEAISKLKKMEKSCFLTTAVCEALDLPDNCDQLQTLRGLRDTFMQETPRRRAEVKEYYEVAPSIVKGIRTLPNPEEIWKGLADKYILPCVMYAYEDKPEKAYLLYKEMFFELKEKYGARK